MKLTPEEIKRWNEAVNTLTGICNNHCTEEKQCEDCPFDSMRFGNYGEPEYCGIRTGVLHRGASEISPEDYLKNLKEKRLRACEKWCLVKNCLSCYWRNKDTNFCPELMLHVQAPESRMCDKWKPRVDLFDKESQP